VEYIVPSEFSRPAGSEILRTAITGYAESEVKYEFRAFLGATKMISGAHVIVYSQDAEAVLLGRIGPCVEYFDYRQ
jgi:hypothetical protein